MNLDTLIPALIGALIGGGLAIIGNVVGVRLQNRHQARTEVATERLRMRGFLGALEAEIGELWAMYNARVGDDIMSLPEGQFLEARWVVSLDYFTVYTANAAIIGRVPDRDLRALIVRTYLRAKGMVETIQMNSQMVEQLAAHRLNYFATKRPAEAERADQYEQALIGYAAAMKLGHAELGSDIDRLVRALQAAQAELAPR